MPRTDKSRTLERVSVADTKWSFHEKRKKQAFFPRRRDFILKRDFLDLKLKIVKLILNLFLLI